MDTERIDELEKLAEAATPRPWEATLSYPYYVSTPLDKGSGLHAKIIDEAFASEDAAFIAAARQAVPELIHQVRKLQLFKEYVHARLDNAGVDKHEEQNATTGCRVGTRLDDVLTAAAELPKVQEYVRALLNDLLNHPELPASIHSKLWAHRQQLTVEGSTPNV